jgi:hypothetical protein
MGKHQTLQAPGPIEEQSDTLDEMEAGFRRAMATAQGAIDSGDVTPQLIRELASVGRVLVSIVAERRALAKARKLQAQSLTTALILEHARLQTPEARQHLVGELLAVDDERSVLA